MSVTDITVSNPIHRRVENPRRVYNGIPQSNKERQKRYRERHRERVNSEKRVQYWNDPTKRRRIMLKSKWRKLGFTVELLAQRPTTCEVCGRSDKKIYLDHNHVTGAFRGWLCMFCNFSIGHACDNPKLLRKLADYLDAKNNDNLPPGRD